MGAPGDTIEEITIMENGRTGQIEEISSWNPYQGYRAYYRVRIKGRPPRTFVTPEQALEYYNLNTGEYDSGRQIPGRN